MSALFMSLMSRRSAIAIGSAATIASFIEKAVRLGIH
jgi:hypothetical protein